MKRESQPAAFVSIPPGSCLPDVVSFSIIDWEFRYQRPQQMLSQFAAHGHRVFYISTSRFIHPNSPQKFAIVPIKENVYEVRLAVPRQPDVYGEVADGEILESLLSSLEALRKAYNIDTALCYVMIASWTKVALESRERWGWRILYDCMDEWENFPLIARSIPEIEKTLVRECDTLVVTAQRLQDKWQAFGRSGVLSRNASDFDFFQPRMTPGDVLKNVAHPVVGYYGAVADWFDIDLAVHIAKSRPRYTFVFVGGIFVNIDPLKALPNVRIEGQQPYELMPQYLHHFDVCIIPFLVNSITEATDPVKFYEYLIGGKPVVSVALPELQPFREHLYIAGSRSEFVQMLDNALQENDADRKNARLEIARRNTWKSRYDTILSAL